MSEKRLRNKIDKITSKIEKLSLEKDTLCQELAVLVSPYNVGDLVSDRYGDQWKITDILYNDNNIWSGGNGEYYLMGMTWYKNAECYSKVYHMPGAKDLIMKLPNVHEVEN